MTESKAEVKSTSKRKISSGVLYVESTFNNTKVSLTDEKGGVLMWSSSGSLGFKGAKKGTPFAAAKIGETLGQKAFDLGLKEISVVVKGVGSGRESAIRGFITKGFTINSIRDITPVPHNGPKPKKPRRV
ncbi:MAG: 30S ribosomal protein S11 [Candidatus Taylorbacteria bacterium RIFOXYD2_FULL_36_9]|uniref:Small ribosomal subunit protein uS11 n=1 Tax=Candidatus Taylorbacteria bacterium RIFOXYD2_FULL_36_9 TaxID=1802338 RepID=A0A1G2PE02_9BACT|nr:MAG: 30S ribosomal protein S11 [Candidatus Taylorbacteria bacterium RIFOXYD2_FULL_36_9]